MIVPLGGRNTMSRAEFGGKAAVLNELAGLGCNVPEGIALSTDVYLQYLRQSGIKPWLSIQLEQKSLDDMRWEELWDLAQTIRLRFLKTPIPESLQIDLLSEISGSSNLADFPAAVRSSSVLEDAPGLSFAGLHDSFTDVKGTFSILSAVREVWSSLWSDRALMYHRELGLDTESAAMGVLVQRFIAGDASGVIFSRSPDNESLAILETVTGYNEDLVSGSREPDRIYVDRKKRRIDKWSKADVKHPVGLSEKTVLELVRIADSLEKHFGHPQDIEWTISDEEIYILQSRPITTIREANIPLWKLEDKRKWHASQHQTMAQLHVLRERITESFLPSVKEVSRHLSAINLEGMDEIELEQEIQRRKDLVDEWEHNYWELFIPFAHGVRLFGEIYNRIVQPESPFEFIELLVHQDFRSIRRNTQLRNIARLISDSDGGGSLEEMPPHIRREIDLFLDEYGQSAFSGSLIFQDPQKLLDFLSASSNSYSRADMSFDQNDSTRLEELFLSSMQALGRREEGEELLDLARLSYRMRDDDNIYVARIRGEYFRAEDMYRRRFSTEEMEAAEIKPEHRSMHRRQVTGTSASEGVAAGPARVILNADDLFQVKEGEVLVCDSIDPNMTFVIPLSAAIVERRGGMLVHGAIIAREYGIPCITGIPDAVNIISTGDMVTVDGYLGIVTIEQTPTAH